ncbi:UDP-N-acetylmuramoyl-L-alanyl-D-glutamate--2,6-diaminopimelate ligase [bacterium]|nr:MAG: UDP-N-acetylmuramoyl-L-alanyl-D-glutamate--2,6-diaminopimelate ligase [bacterium]
MALTLAQIQALLPDTELCGEGNTIISNVTADSRQAGPDTLFVAVRGTRRDGHEFLAAVRAAGVGAVACTRGNVEKAGDGPILVAADTRDLPARIARLLNGRPDAALRTVAVTGTNGKTTVSFLLQALLGELEGPCGLLGTIFYDDGRVRESAPLTTPGGPVLYAWLERMRAAGCRSVALEISSHALDQQRVAGLELDVAVMTNLGRDHLDYHGDAAAYLAAKTLITGRLRPEQGVLVVNGNDPALAGITAGDHQVVRFSTNPEVCADLRVLHAELDLRGSRLELDWRGRTLELTSPLVGRFNVENLAAALAAGLALGYPADSCVEALAAVRQVPGRLEQFALPSGALAVVDYAHTHDALAAVLSTCDELSAGRILLVFGCGGDRDRGKRVLMGEVAAQAADLAWITSDNPRSEDPASICAGIVAGFDAVKAPRAEARQVVVDRTMAIRAALAASRPSDVVVVAGKGHEDYQLVGERVLDLDDRRIVRDWLREVAL